MNFLLDFSEKGALAGRGEKTGSGFVATVRRKPLSYRPDS
jgi:hypothetical protein